MTTDTPTTAPRQLIAIHYFSDADEMYPALAATDALGLGAEVIRTLDPAYADIDGEDMAEEGTQTEDEADVDAAWPWTVKLFALTIPIKMRH